MNAERRVLVAVALLAAAVRLPGVYTQAFWQDEVASARIIAEPTFPRLLAHVARTESTPPLWYALAWLAHRAGTPLQDVRLLSVLAGALLAAAVVDLAQRFVPLPLAALAGVLTAISGELVVHGHELRAYELLALLSVVLARCALAEVEEPSRRHELALAGVVAAGGLTHYFFGFSVAAVLAWLWFEPAARAVRHRASAAVVGGGVVAASWTPVMLEQFHRDRFWWIGAFRLRPVVAVPARLFTTAYANTTPGVAVSAAGLLLVVVGCLHLSRVSPAGRLVAVLALAPLAEAAVLWSAGVRIFSLRNLVGIAPFVAVGAVGALAALPWRTARVAAVASAWAVVLLSLPPLAGSGVPRYDTLARALVAAGWTPSQPVAVFGNFFRYRSPLEWYLPHRPLLDATRPRGGVCRTVFVIRGVHVVRLRLDRPIRTVRRLRGATILADPGRAQPCVRPITRGRLAALA